MDDTTLTEPAIDPDHTAPLSFDARDLEDSTARVPVEPLDVPFRPTPAYLIEVRRPRAAPTLLAIRATLADAQSVAEGVHPGVAEVVIHEVPLPCDAATLARRMGDLRTWTREGHSWRLG